MGALKRQARRCFFEPLEERKVLATLILNASTAGDDTIDISDNGGNLRVTRNGTEIYNNTVAGFDAVQINADDGADVFNLNSIPSGSAGSPTVAELEPNDNLAQAQDLDGAGWHVDPIGSPDPDIDDELGDRSTIDEHITVIGSGDDTVDVYAFTIVVGSSPVNLLFDIDHTSPSFDSYIELIDESGTVVDFADDGTFADGGSTNDSDSFLSHTIGATGTYHWFLRVGSFDGLGNPPTGIPSGEPYELQVVIPGHAVPGGGAPLIIVNGEGGNDTLNVAAGLMPLSAVDPNVVEVGPAPFAGTLSHGADEVAQYQSVETFNGGAAFTVLTELVDLGLQDGIADTTFVRPDAGGTKLLVDVNATPHFGGGINQILIIEVNGSSDADTITVQNTVIGAHIDGGDGNDTITTSQGPDIVYGGGGDDTISTGDGDDYAAGGADNDTISSGDGNDSLHGNAGHDILSGQQGHDVVSGGAGNDQVAGHQGQDVLIGGSGLDQVLGNSDRDLLFASGVVVWEAGSPISLGESDSSEFGDDNYFRLQDLREDWLDVVAMAMVFQTFADKYDSGADDLVEDKLQGGNGDDVFFSDGTARIVDSAGDRDITT